MAEPAAELAPTPEADDPDAPETDEAGPLRRISTMPSMNESVTVTIGTSSDAGNGFAKHVSSMVNSAYGYGRLSPHEVLHRLAMGDAGDDANRVLHLAWRESQLVGCCSSTLSVPWAPRGCGHWGLLVVAVEAQGTGVASALVAAAEARLHASGLASVQIEYEYTCGDPQSERLLAWYEGALGFHGGGAPTRSAGRTEFRRCRKRLGAPRSPSSRKKDGADTTPGSSSSSGRSSDGERGMVKSVPSASCASCVRRMLRVLFGT